MTSPRSDAEWATIFYRELVARSERLLTTRGRPCVGGLVLVVNGVEIMGDLKGSLRVRWWDGQAYNHAINTNISYDMDSFLVGSIVLPILREEMVLDDLAAV